MVFLSTETMRLDFVLTGVLLELTEISLLSNVLPSATLLLLVRWSFKVRCKSELVLSTVQSPTICMEIHKAASVWLLLAVPITFTLKILRLDVKEDAVNLYNLVITSLKNVPLVFVQQMLAHQQPLNITILKYV